MEICKIIEKVEELEKRINDYVTLINDAVSKSDRVAGAMLVIMWAMLMNIYSYVVDILLDLKEVSEK